MGEGSFEAMCHGDGDYELYSGGGRRSGDDCPSCNVCKYCGCDGLDWRNTERGWRLYDLRGNVHLCRTKKTEI